MSSTEGEMCKPKTEGHAFFVTTVLCFNLLPLITYYQTVTVSRPIPTYILLPLTLKFTF